MRIKRFTAPDMRTALRMVRDEQGPDAVILSSRQAAEGGVEVVAATDYDEALVQQTLRTMNVPTSAAETPVARSGERAVFRIDGEEVAPLPKAEAPSPMALLASPAAVALRPSTYAPGSIESSSGSLPDALKYLSVVSATSATAATCTHS